MIDYFEQTAGGAGQGRACRILISHPRDVLEEVRVVEDAVERLRTSFRGAGYAVSTWRYGLHGRPGVGADAQAVVDRQLPREYDIHIGIMCQCVGTPTATANSGTLAELDSAIQRRASTGSPEILFYFCSEPSNDASLERSRFPGLYWVYDSLGTLKADVTYHLLDWLLTQQDRALHRSDRLTSSDLRSDGGDAVGGLVSVGAIARTSVEEQDRLRAALADRYAKNPTSAAHGSILATLDSILEPTSSSAVPAHDGYVAALLGVVSMLERDQRHLDFAEAGSGEWWLRRRTKRISLSSGGALDVRVECPALEEAELIRGLHRAEMTIGLIRLQPYLLDRDLGLSMGRVQIELREGAPPLPLAVREELRQRRSRARYWLLDHFSHLGEADGAGLRAAADLAMPIPGSALIGALPWPRQAIAHDQLRVLTLNGDGSEVLRFTKTESTAPIDLRNEPLQPGVTYLWTLVRDGREEACGPFSLLGLENARVWHTAREVLAWPEQLRLADRLRLHGEYLSCLLAATAEGRSIDETHYLTAARFVADAYDWVEAEASWSNQLSHLRNLGGLLIREEEGGVS